MGRTETDTTYPGTSPSDWAEDVNPTCIPTSIMSVTPAVHAPRDFSHLRSDEQNPWNSLSRRHQRFHPRNHSRRNLPKCSTYVHTPRVPALPTPPPIQPVETVRHPYRIGPTKPVIKIRASTASATPEGSPPLYPTLELSAPPPAHSVATIQCHCGQLLSIPPTLELPTTQLQDTLFQTHFLPLFLFLQCFPMFLGFLDATRASL